MRGVAACLVKLLFLTCVLCHLSPAISAQHTSRDNYAGKWKSPATWSPEWTDASDDLEGISVDIYGLVTSEGSLSFSGSTSVLTVHDTLVIKGNLIISNNSQIIVEDNGILIVRGNLTIENQGNIAANGYLVITGNFSKTGSAGQGSFSSNDNPVKVFLNGIPDPVTLKNNPDYPVLNCDSPPTLPYIATGCSYGNLTDLANDPLFSFFASTCSTVAASSDSPVCEGTGLNLSSSDGGTSYEWTGPQGFSSPLQNPGISSASSLNAGEYNVIITLPDGCIVSASTEVSVTPAPLLIISDPVSVCVPMKINLTAPSITAGSATDLTLGYWNNREATSACSNPESVAGGTYYIKGMSKSGCYSIKPVIAVVNPLPPVAITSSINALCLNDKKRLTGYPEGGSFVVFSGPGILTGNVLSATGPGDVEIIYTYSGQCTSTAIQMVHFFDTPVPFAGPDQELRDVFETQMNARLSPHQTGEWTLISGAGQILDIHSPYSRITGLETGVSVFRWKVTLGSCETSDEVRIKVLDLFVPSVITPNGDGKNDNFTVYSLNGRAELMIFNRWGVIEYSNPDYKNDWGGTNDKGSELPAGTYLFVLKLESGLVKKGTVLIKR